MIDKEQLSKNIYLIKNLRFEIKGENQFSKKVGFLIVELDSKKLGAKISIDETSLMPKKKRERKKLIQKNTSEINALLNDFENKFNLKVKRSEL